MNEASSLRAKKGNYAQRGARGGGGGRGRGSGGRGGDYPYRSALEEVGEAAGVMEEGFYPLETIFEDNYKPLANYMLQQSPNPLNKADTLSQAQDPAYSGQSTSKGEEELRSVIATIKMTQNKLVDQLNLHTKAIEAQDERMDRHTDAVEEREKEKAERKKEREKAEAIKLAEIERETLKPYVVFTGMDLPKRMNDENLAKEMAVLCMKKWGVTLYEYDVIDGYRSEDGSITLKLANITPRSTHDQLLRRRGYWQGVGQEAKAIRIDVKPKMAALDKEILSVLLFLKDLDKNRAKEENRVAKFHVAREGKIHYKTGDDLKKERTENTILLYRWANHPDDVTKMILNPVELKALHDRIPPEHFSGLQRPKRRGGKSSAQRRLAKELEGGKESKNGGKGAKNGGGGGGGGEEKEKDANEVEKMDMTEPGNEKST